MPELKLSEETKIALKAILEECENEDSEARQAQIRTWQKNEMFWHGMQHLFWSRSNETWISPADVNWREGLSAEELDEVSGFDDVVIDIFKPHGESIIAALSSQLPTVRFLPDDADSETDVLTARTYNKIVDLLYRHNRAKLVFFRALFYIFIHGIVFSYRYKDTDKKYGTYEVPQYGMEDVIEEVPHCAECEGQNIQDVTDPAYSNKPQVCQDCGSTNIKTETVTRSKPTQTGTETLPKSRAKLDIFGPLHVKVSRGARNQDECGYLILYSDAYKTEAKALFGEDFEKEIDGESVTDSDRTSHLEGGDEESGNKILVKQVWIRPSRYWAAKRAGRLELEKKYPDGCHVTFLGKESLIAEVDSEDLDDRWEIGVAGLSTLIHADPLCRPLTPIQELRNLLVNLTKDTIRYGIPSGFADPSALNFDSWGKFEAAPGYTYQAKPKGNRPLGDSFYTTERATLSSEVPAFMKSLDLDAQFSSGSQPALYGGPSEGKSRTFSEYAASGEKALQRLSIAWTFMTDWWQRTMHGLVDLYVGMLVEDEHYAVTEGGSYVNVWIRQSNLKGKVGGVESEGSDSFPVSLIQKRGMIEKFIELNNPDINAVLYSPENAGVIQDVLAFPELKIPGEVQRIKQLVEINELARDEPVEDPNAPGGAMPSVMPEPDVDDDEVHIQVLKYFLADTTGLDLKRENLLGYLNIKAHLALHEMSLQLKTMSQTATPPGEPPDTTATTEEI